MLGRTIAREECVKGGPHVMVVTHHFWQEFLSGDPQVLGKSVVLNGDSYTVIGVMPRGFDLPEEHADIFVSLWVGYPEAAPWRGVHFMRTYWRLKPGVTVAQAQADLTGIATRLATEFPETEGKREKTIVPLHEWLVGDVRPALLILFGAVGLVLLIACANFAGLLTARSIARRQEFVIRASLGAGKSRLIRQTLTESAVLALLGGGVGLLLAKWGTSFLVSLEAGGIGAVQRNSSGRATVCVCVRDFAGDRSGVRVDSGAGCGAGEYRGVVEGERAKRDFGKVCAGVAKWVGGGGVCAGVDFVGRSGAFDQGICAIAVGESGIQRRRI